MSLSINNLTVAIDQRITLDNVSLEVPQGSLFALLGPSGCGKSTLLKTIAGLICQESGKISWAGQVIDQLPPEKRNMTLVFQDLRLFPHMTVLDNVAFSLKMAGVPTASRNRAAEEMLSLVKMEGLEQRRPHQLSGGQQQRTVLARALVAKPRVLLLDEPFSGLDAPLRAEMRQLVKDLHRALGTTMVLVTHDRLEALGMSDLMAVMAPSRILQVGPPQEIYHHPKNLAVARQLFAGNIVEGIVEQGWFNGKSIRFAVSDPLLEGPMTALMPPESLTLIEEAGPYHVTDIEFAGDHLDLILRSGDLRLEVKAAADQVARVGDQVGIFVRSDAVLLFPDEPKADLLSER